MKLLCARDFRRKGVHYKKGDVYKGPHEKLCHAAKLLHLSDEKPHDNPHEIPSEKKEKLKAGNKSR